VIVLVQVRTNHGLYTTTYLYKSPHRVLPQNSLRLRHGIGCHFRDSDACGLNYGITTNSLFKIAELDNTVRKIADRRPQPPPLTNASDRNRHGNKVLLCISH